MSGSGASPAIEYGRNTNKVDVFIIGASISSMTAAIEVIRKGTGRKFIIVEKGNQVGGTWNDTRYPGACCTPGATYTLSFEPNANWTREYPGQEETQDYQIGITHKYELYRHIRFSTSVEEARWDNASKIWKTKVARLGSKDAEYGEKYPITSDFLVSTVGMLSIPKYPDMQGLDRFRGKMMHSAQWDWEYDISGKRIAIISNSATAAQIISEAAKVCKSLTVFQRTPSWVFPRGDKPISSISKAVFKYVLFVRSRHRAGMMDFREAFFDGVFYTESPMKDLLMSLCKDHMAAQLPGEKYARLRQRLQPQLPLGCKRVVISDDYFSAFARDDVHLESVPIWEITEKGIRVDSGEEYAFDVIILATGFKATQFMYPMKVYGDDGKVIEEHWFSGASAYLGITVPSLPTSGCSMVGSLIAGTTSVRGTNLIAGPNTNLGHNKIILIIETQALHINELIRKIKRARSRGGSLKIQPRPDVVEQYNKEIQVELSQSAFANPDCKS